MLRWKNLGLFFKSCIIVFVLIVICASVFMALYINSLELKDNRYDSIILAASIRYNVDPDFIKAVIWRESAFRQFIIGTKRERGLMQIMEKNAVQDWANSYGCPVPPSGILYSPEININIGTWYLAKCRTHWSKYKNSLALTLAEYNAGYRNAKEWAPSDINADVLERIKFPSTKSYVKTILEKYAAYKQSESRFGK